MVLHNIDHTYHVKVNQCDNFVVSLVIFYFVQHKIFFIVDVSPVVQFFRDVQGCDLIRIFLSTHLAYRKFTSYLH